MGSLMSVLAALACLLAVTPALAQSDDPGEPFQPIDAQAMIDACWEATHELRMDVFGARQGILDSALCLEERIVEQLEALVPQDSFSREEAAEQLRATRMA
ncbi:MAG: hypothetical protein Tsb0032_00260 [Kiloniellaceae bacterium]